MFAWAYYGFNGGGWARERAKKRSGREGPYRRPPNAYVVAFGGLGTRGPKTRRAAINDPGAFGSDPRNPRLNPSGLGCGRVHETVSARVATTEERYQFAEVRRTLLVVLDIERITRATTNTVIEVVHLIDRANQYRLRYTVPYRPDVP